MSPEKTKSRFFGLAVVAMGLCLIFLGFNLGLYGHQILADYKPIKWAGASLLILGAVIFVLGFGIQGYQLIKRFLLAAKGVSTDRPTNSIDRWVFAGRR